MILQKKVFALETALADTSRAGHEHEADGVSGRSLVPAEGSLDAGGGPIWAAVTAKICNVEEALMVRRSAQLWAVPQHPQQG